MRAEGTGCWGVGFIYVCESVTEGSNAALLGGQRRSEAHSLLILLSIAVAAGHTHYGDCDARHHLLLLHM